VIALPRNVPEGWVSITLKQIGELTQGGTPDTSNSLYWKGPYPFITGADIKELYVKEGRSTLSETGFNSSKTERAEAGNVLIVSRTRVGRIGIAATNLAVSQDVSVLKLKPEYNAKCVALILLSQSDKLQDAAQGATIKGLTRDYLENIELQFPEDLHEQEVLAAKIEKRINLILKLRVNAEQQLEAINALAAATLRECFHFEESTNA